MKTKIIAALKNIEQEYGVRILYACESGSRAFGFPSKDSDYDVRFIYAHSVDVYLSIDPIKCDTITRKEGELDIVGWDLRKTLGLLRKSNPNLLEWLNSPEVYLTTKIAEEIYILATYYFSVRTCAKHYLSMSKNTYLTYLNKPAVQFKKYLYALRPLFALFWLYEKKGFVPVDFFVLLEQFGENRSLINEIMTVIEKKRAGELEVGRKNAVLDDFISRMLAIWPDVIDDFPVSNDESIEPLSSFFRKTIKDFGPI